MSFEGTDAEAGYQHSRAALQILTMFVGVGEITALMKTGKLSATAIKTLRKGLKGLSKQGLKRLVRKSGKKGGGSIKSSNSFS